MARMTRTAKTIHLAHCFCFEIFIESLEEHKSTLQVHTMKETSDLDSIKSLLRRY